MCNGKRPGLCCVSPGGSGTTIPEALHAEGSAALDLQGAPCPLAQHNPFPQPVLLEGGPALINDFPNMSSGHEILQVHYETQLQASQLLQLE